MSELAPCSLGVAAVASVCRSSGERLHHLSQQVPSIEPLTSVIEAPSNNNEVMAGNDDDVLSTVARRTVGITGDLIFLLVGY